MSDRETAQLAHVVATIDTTEGSGSILYVNPSNVPSGSREASGMGGGEVALVLRDANGVEIGRVHPEIRYDACDAHDPPHLGLIQQDVELPDGVAEIELVRGGAVLDTFRPDEPPPPGPIAADLALGPPMSGGSRRDFGAAVEPHKGVTYLIQARPDNGQDWHTLSIGRRTPEFQIDRNQFPGARSVAVRVIQSTGFARRTVDERTIPLD
jgi:hypothetical protein